MEANYFTVLYWFCHTSTWIRHGCTRVPHYEPHFHLPPHPIPLGLLSFLIEFSSNTGIGNRKKKKKSIVQRYNSKTLLAIRTITLNVKQTNKNSVFDISAPHTKYKLSGLVRTLPSWQSIWEWNTNIYSGTSPEYCVSCIEPGLAIYSTFGNIHVSMLSSQIIPPSPSPTESKSLFFTSVSLLLSHI